MWPVSADLAAALRSGHEMTTTVNVIRGTTGVVEQIRVQDGYVNATLGSTITRSANLQVDHDVIHAGLLNPLVDTVQIRTGVANVGDVPIFTGRPMTPTTTGNTGNVNVHCEDYTGDLVRADFEQPWLTTANTKVSLEITRIIQDVSIAFGVDTSQCPNGTTPTLIFESNRTRALNELAAGVNALILGDRVGGFIVRPNPYILVAPPIAAIFRDGVDGVLVSIKHTRSRERIKNSITVVIERSDNSSPIRVTVRDNDLNSLTRWGGPFGKSNQIIKIQSPISAAEATTLAGRILRQSLALAESWQIDVPHYPLLDPGDVIGVVYQDAVTSQIVESVTYNLTANKPTQITTRQLLNFTV